MSGDSPWHAEVLPDGWLDAASHLKASGVVESFYLAGGTGLALEFGHRASVDLDLFTDDSFEPHSIRDRLRDAPGLRTIQMAPDSLDVELHRVKISFLRYPYSRLFPTRRYMDLEVADARDIACMKLDAVASRGSRRDFIDLYFLAQHYPLPDLWALFAAKYASVSPNLVHLAKALTYFSDAELEPMPHMLAHVEWNGVKAFFEREVPKVLR
jgi:hypothetical protein